MRVCVCESLFYVHLGSLDCNDSLFDSTRRSLTESRVIFDKLSLNHKGYLVLFLHLGFKVQRPFEGNIEKWKTMKIGVIINSERIFFEIEGLNLQVHKSERLLRTHALWNVQVLEDGRDIKQL